MSMAARGRAALAAAAALLALTGTGAGAAEPMACEDLDPPRTSLEVVLQPAQAPRVRAASERQIVDRAGQGGLDRPRGRAMRGLTSSELRGSVRSTLVEAELPNRRRCTGLKAVRAEAGNRRQTVYIDSRYAPGSCQYRAILAHEREHVRINDEALREMAPMLRQALAEVAERWSDRWFAAPQRDAMARDFQAAFDRALQAIHEAAARRHAAIDAPASYDAVQAECRAW